METAPVVQQLGLMQGSPFHGQCQGAGRETAVKEANRGDPDLGFRAAVGGVEVGWVVIEEVHPNHDPKESGDFGHEGNLAETAVGV